MNHMRLCLSFSAIGVILLAGCGGSSDQPDTFEVQGTIKMDGEPLSGAEVLFGPQNGGRTSIGYTDDDGYYELMYLPDTPGAIAGPHTVSISIPFMDEDESDPSAQFYIDPVPAKYNKESTLTKEVSASEENVFDFDLESQ